MSHSAHRLTLGPALLFAFTATAVGQSTADDARTTFAVSSTEPVVSRARSVDGAAVSPLQVGMIAARSRE